MSCSSNRGHASLPVGQTPLPSRPVLSAHLSLTATTHSPAPACSVLTPAQGSGPLHGWGNRGPPADTLSHPVSQLPSCGHEVHFNSPHRPSQKDATSESLISLARVPWPRCCLLLVGSNVQQGQPLCPRPAGRTWSPGKRAGPWLSTPKPPTRRGWAAR